MAASIEVISHDLAGGVDPIGNGLVRAGHVERGVAAIIEEEAVDEEGSIEIKSDDLAGGVDAVGIGGGIVQRRAWHIKRGESVSGLALGLSRHPKERAQSHQTAE
jgi:hypothetical protein